MNAGFDVKGFENPEAIFWPGSFWCWNGPLEPEVLKAQLRDMNAHGFRSVCMLPLPHGFRPDNTNNQMDPDYLTPEYFERVRIAVEEAARLGMNWWLYDEGGWPSGQALGKVTEGHPELRQHRLVREAVDGKTPYTVPQDAVALVVEGSARKVVAPGQTWTPAAAGETAYVYRMAAGGYVDLLDPDATKRFIELTHEGYRRAVGEHFGKTIRFTFTDEPGAPNLDPPKSITWTPGLDVQYKQRFGRDLPSVLPELFTVPGPSVSAEIARARIEFYDLWTDCFRRGYFKVLEDWCHAQGLGSGGHLNGEDETINVVRYGFGHALRQLRAMDVPGVDVIWRQLFTGKPNPHHFPKYASTAAHQNGTRYAVSESFCVYGNGLTPAQMKWVLDYQYVRGINLLVVGCYPLSSRDHLMTGERPHFGSSDPLWDHLAGFSAYVARLGYALSLGKPKISTALYYPVRDMWACGLEEAEAARSHDALANELFASQCDFDLIDDDLLLEPSTRIEKGALVAGAMQYDTIICGGVRWMHPEALELLRRFAERGGHVVCVAHPPGTDGAPGETFPGLRVLDSAGQIGGVVQPTAKVQGSGTRNIRVTGRILSDGEILFFFNEGGTPFEGELPSIKSACHLDPQTGRFLNYGSESHLPLKLLPGESLLLFLPHEHSQLAVNQIPSGDTIVLDATLAAEPRRRSIVGDHDYEWVAPGASDRVWWGKYEGLPVPFSNAAAWKAWLGEDYSGEVDYKAAFEAPRAWEGGALLLQTGPIEYAASVFLDGALVGNILWPPWEIRLPACAPGPHELVIRVANTLANELTSERVTNLWASKSGPGWPSPYHKRALEFERESRGGGLAGPVIIRRLKEIASSE